MSTLANLSDLSAFRPAAFPEESPALGWPSCGPLATLQGAGCSDAAIAWHEAHVLHRFAGISWSFHMILMISGDST